MGFIHRNSLPCAVWPQWLGTLCRMGGHGEETRHRGTRRACKSSVLLLLSCFDRVDSVSNLDTSSLVRDIMVPLVPPLTSTSQPLWSGPCCSSVPQLRLWDPKTGKPIGEPLKGHSKWVTSLAWEPIHLCVCISFPVSSCFRSP